jgi:replication factor C subunit 2/4
MLEDLCSQTATKHARVPRKRRSWIKKHHPKDITDLYLPDQLLLKIHNLLGITKLNTSVPNMLITGAPGIGKTAMVKLLANKIYGKYYNDAVMELNASDNRGLEIINNSIIYFCKKKLHDDSDIPITKLVILDEADNITKKAQNMISNFMEEYGNNTNFVFTCNDSSKLIESIQSRCLIMYFPHVSKVLMTRRLEHIAKQEGVSYDGEAIDTIVNCSKGDLRLAISILEMQHFANNRQRLTLGMVQQLNHQPSCNKLMKLIELCVNKDLRGAISVIKGLKLEGYCASDILLNINNTINNMKIEEDTRLRYIKHISKSYIFVSDGIDSSLQLYGCISDMVLS